jgi:LCP family protein required for cell wall assembly
VSRDRSPAKSGSSASRPLPARLDPRSEPVGVAHWFTPRWRKVTVVLTRSVCALLSVLLLAGGGWGWYLGRVAQAGVNRTDAIPGNADRPVGSAMNLLLVGNDSRADLTDEQRSAFSAGKDSGLNTDTIILAHVPADGSRASFVSFPRDSYVEIPGHGRDKLNAAYAYGYGSVDSSQPESERQTAGSQLLVRTVSQLTGLQIDHYAEVDLLGFFNLSTVVGGVEVNLCKAVNDKKSGAAFAAGAQTISGVDALRFVRQRHGLPRGDFDRIVRQQTFIAGMIRKMLSDNVLFDLGKQHTLVQAAADALTVDQSLDLLSLAQQMQSVTPGNIDFQTVPNLGTGKEGDKSVVLLEDVDSLHAFFADLSADPAPATSTAPATPAAPTTVAPSAVDVAVLNGSGTAGLAADTAAALQAAGYVVASSGNADSSDYTATEIRYAAGDEAQANTLVAAIPGAKAKKADGATSGTVQLVLGSDFNGVGQAVTPPATSAAAPTTGTKKPARSAADTTCIN